MEKILSKQIISKKYLKNPPKNLPKNTPTLYYKQSKTSTKVLKKINPTIVQKSKRNPTKNTESQKSDQKSGMCFPYNTVIHLGQKRITQQE